jgi:hypothetical protein
LWFLNNGATNHMAGIDTSIRGTVRFGVGSEFAIEGSGMVVFEGKLGDHL